MTTVLWVGRGGGVRLTRYLVVILNDLLGYHGVLLEGPGQLDHILGRLLLHLLMHLHHSSEAALKTTESEKIHTVDTFSFL